MRRAGQERDSLTDEIAPRKSEAGAKISMIPGGGILVSWVKKSLMACIHNKKDVRLFSLFTF